LLTCTVIVRHSPLSHSSEGGVGRYVFLGDYVGYGADPGWVVDKVISYVRQGALAATRMTPQKV
jgi:fermentation-respiration switch protein FrsA (DUF1100 family)